jgi:hypothetical protein
MRYAVAIPLIVVAFLLGSATAQPAPLSAQFVPVIRNGQVVATVCDGTAPILAQDTGSLSAIRDADGRYLIAYQDRAHGSVAHVAQHVGASLDEVTAPALRAALMPQFSPSGIKQGSLALVSSQIPGGKSRLYYTQRTPEDEARNAGPYGIWCMEF